MKICPYCHTEPSAGRNICYCKFCELRLARIRWAYRRMGKSMRVQDLHRTWNYWRRSPELDLLYLDPLEQAA